MRNKDSESRERNDAMSVLLLSGTPKEASIQNYLDEGQTIKLFEGEQIDKQYRGDDDLYIFYIVSGSIAARMLHNDGTITELLVREAGDVFINGSRSDLLPGPPYLCFSAVENTVLVGFSKKQAVDLMQRDEGVCRDFFYYMEMGMSQLSQRVDTLASSSSTLRMLLWIDKLCEANEAGMDKVYRIPCDISIGEIADILRIHRTTCQKILKGLKERRIADRTKNYIVVYDRDGLRSLLESDNPVIY